MLIFINIGALFFWRVKKKTNSITFAPEPMFAKALSLFTKYAKVSQIESPGYTPGDARMCVGKF